MSGEVTVELVGRRMAGKVTARFSRAGDYARTITFGTRTFAPDEADHITINGVDYLLAGLAVSEHHKVWTARRGGGRFLRRADVPLSRSDPSGAAATTLVEWATLVAPRLAEQNEGAFNADPSDYAGAGMSWLTVATELSARAEIAGDYADAHCRLERATIEPDSTIGEIRWETAGLNDDYRQPAPVVAVATDEVGDFAYLVDARRHGDVAPAPLVVPIGCARGAGDRGGYWATSR